jgi:hypothetical protein
MNPVYTDKTITNNETPAPKVDQKKRVVKAPIQKVKSSFSAMQKFWEDNISLIKDHLPIPPREGLVWDPVKHRWVRPEKAGQTVAQANNGKIRFRGSGTGASSKTIGSKKGMERFLSQRRGKQASARRRKV